MFGQIFNNESSGIFAILARAEDDVAYIVIMNGRLSPVRSGGERMGIIILFL